jgi:DNA-binding Lrp family transcriptional regulator
MWSSEIGRASSRQRTFMHIEPICFALLVMARDLADLQQLTMSTIAGMDGVSSVETMVFSEILKYRSEPGPL